MYAPNNDYILEKSQIGYIKYGVSTPKIYMKNQNYVNQENLLLKLINSYVLKNIKKKPPKRFFINKLLPAYP